MENPGITIREKHYELPTLDTITLDEERVLYLYADSVVRDFIPAHPEATDEERATYERLQLIRLRNPDFKRALAMVAVKRAHPEIAQEEIITLSGEANALEVDIAMLWGDGPDPPAVSSQKPLESRRSTSEPSRSTDFGSSTLNGSDAVDVTPASTGTIGSETSSPGARPIELVS